MRKDHKRLTREVLDSMRDWYEENISSLREENRTEMKRLMRVMDEEKAKAEKEKMEAEMTVMDADINEALK